MKLFIGARVSPQTANALALAVETMARRASEQKLDLRFVPPANYHVTLRFLGHTRPDVLPALRDRLNDAITGVVPFAFRTARVTAERGMIWAHVERPEPLVDLAARIEKVVVDLGWAAEPRPFRPHITLARSARESGPLNTVVLPVSEQMFSESRVGGITIIESETKSNASVYSDIARLAFKPADFGASAASKRQMGDVQMDAPHELETDDGWPRGQGPTD